jgi:large subunit ribosomal protein L9
VKIVLRTDVSGLGKRGDIAEVADGYARNYLLPKGKALVATPGVEAQAEAMRRARAVRSAADRADAITLADRLAASPITIRAKAGREGKLFGSVGTADIAAAIEAQIGARIDRRNIALSEPIKSVGTFDVVASLPGDVAAPFRVTISGS